MKYQDYLKTEHWKNLRQKAFKHYGYQCFACSTKENLHVHHLIYRDLFNVKVKDLRPLCAKCHDLIHQILLNKKLINGGDFKYQPLYKQHWIRAIKELYKVIEPLRHIKQDSNINLIENTKLRIRKYAVMNIVGRTNKKARNRLRRNHEILYKAGLAPKFRMYFYVGKLLSEIPWLN